MLHTLRPRLTMMMNIKGKHFQNNLEDSPTFAMMLLARAITQHYSTPTNNRLCSSSNIRNQVVVQADRVNIQSKNVGNDGRIARRLYKVHEETAEGSNFQKETENVQRNLQTSSSGNVSNVQCYNCNEKGHYARNCPKPRVRDSKYFMEQMLLAKKDEEWVILSKEQNDFLLADTIQMEELEELSSNICMMAIIQPANVNSDEDPSYDSAFISEMNGDEDKYLDDISNLEAKVKTNENVVIKMSQSVQALFMLGPKPLSFYDPKLKHGLGYENPYML
ncbi:gag-pol polyprotein [Tanacetum coccineum]